jgi:nucleotide-binding universal stress UspA family protein
MSAATTPAPARLQIRKVLFPTDFSSCAEQAFAQALSFAAAFGAELHVMHALAPGWEGLYDAAAYAAPSGEAHEQARRAAEARLASLANAPRAAAVRLTTSVAEGYPPAPAILDQAQRDRVDLIVMGTHGRRGPARLLLGSVAEEVARQAECPVLAVRERSVDNGPGRLLPRRVLVPFDFSAPARAALADAAEVARRLDSRLLLLHVVEERRAREDYGPLPRASDAAVEQAVTVARLRLADLLSYLAPGVPGDVEVRTGTPATEILAAAARPDVDLIVMSTRGLSGVRRLFFGSTAEEVLRLAAVSVLLVKPQAPKESPEVAAAAVGAGAGGKP